MVARKATIEFHAGDKTGDAFKSVQRSLQNLASAAGAVGGPLGQVSGRLSTLGTALGRMSIVGAGGAIGLAALAFEMKNVYDTASELESTLFKLSHQIRLSGDHAGVTLGRVERFASGLAKSTLVTKEAILEASSTLFAFQSIGGKTHETLLRLGVDLTRSVGGGLVENIKILGKVVDDPVQNLGALRDKVGDVGKAWQDNVIAMAEAGDKAGATAAILAKLEKTIGGGAEAEAGGLRGMVHALTEEWNDLREAFGKGIGLSADVGGEKYQKFLKDEAALLALVVAERKKVSDADLTTKMGFDPSFASDARASLAGYERALAELRGANPSEAEATKRHEIQLVKDGEEAKAAARLEADAKLAEKRRKQREKDAAENLSDERKSLARLAELRVATAVGDEKPLARYVKLDADILAEGAEAGRLGLKQANEYAELRLNAAKAFAEAHFQEIDADGKREIELRRSIQDRLAKDEARTPEQRAGLKFAEISIDIQALPAGAERDALELRAHEVFLSDLEELDAEKRDKIAKRVQDLHVGSLTDGLRAEEEYLADVETLQIARAANVIKTEEELQREILALTDKFHRSQLDKEKATLGEKLSLTASAFGDLAGAFSGYSDITQARITRSAEEQTQATKNEFDLRLFALQDSNAAGLLSDEEFSDRKKQLERDKGNAIVAIEQSTRDRMNSEGRKAFEVSKKLSIAQATLSGVVSVISAFEAGTKVGGPYVGAAFAAAAGAFVATNIAKLSATTFGGGGSVGVGGGSLPSTPRDATARSAKDSPPSTLQVIFNGPTYGIDDFNKKVGEAVRANSDRDVIMITSGSRQATEIRRA